MPFPFYEILSYWKECVNIIRILNFLFSSSCFYRGKNKKINNNNNTIDTANIFFHVISCVIILFCFMDMLNFLLEQFVKKSLKKIIFFFQKTRIKVLTKFEATYGKTEAGNNSPYLHLQNETSN